MVPKIRRGSRTHGLLGATDEMAVAGSGAAGTSRP